MQYKNGLITSTAAAVNLQLGFVPDKFKVTNNTILEASPLTGVGYSEWNKYMPDASTIQSTFTAGVTATSYVTTNGFTPQRSGGVYASTVLTITGFVKATGVVTLSSIGSLVNGDTITISGVLGTTQLNTNRYIVGSISGSTFVLYDFFGNAVNTSAYGTYVSGGQIDIISTPAVAPVINATTGQVTTPGQPAGLQLDTGYYGITLGTSVVGASTNQLFWEAWSDTPAGY
jgi:adhesin HecA-like repeat protein